METRNRVFFVFVCARKLVYAGSENLPRLAATCKDADCQAQRERLAKLDAGELSLDDLRNDAGAKEKRQPDELQAPAAKG